MDPIIRALLAALQAQAEALEAQVSMASDSLSHAMGKALDGQVRSMREQLALLAAVLEPEKEEPCQHPEEERINLGSIGVRQFKCGVCGWVSPEEEIGED